MSEVQILLTKNYEKRLVEVEDFIYESSSKNIAEVEKFLSAHERVLEFLK